jgi:hypothetical protein
MASTYTLHPRWLCSKNPDDSASHYLLAEPTTTPLWLPLHYASLLNERGGGRNRKGRRCSALVVFYSSRVCIFIACLAELLRIESGPLDRIELSCILSFSARPYFYSLSLGLVACIIV